MVWCMVWVVLEWFGRVLEFFLTNPERINHVYLPRPSGKSDGTK